MISLKSQLKAIEFGLFLVLLGTLQQFDEGAPREQSFMAIADAEGMVLAFPFLFF